MLLSNPSVPSVKGNGVGLGIWSQVQATDPKFTKSFSRGGGFKGTATNATWLAKKATEMFGPMGLGWGVKVLDESILDGANGEKVHRVHAELWYMLEGQRGSIEHFGMTTFIGKNKNGQFTDEEAPKKSLTDAMSKCLSLLGFAADVHLGMFDDNKYVNAVEAHYEKQEAAAREEKRAARAAPKEETLAEAVTGASDAAITNPMVKESSQPDADDEARNDEQYNSLTEEQRDLIAKIEACPSVATVTNLMKSDETKLVFGSSSKVEVMYIRARAARRLRDHGWPNVQKIAADAQAG